MNWCNWFLRQSATPYLTLVLNLLTQKAAHEEQLNFGDSFGDNSNEFSDLFLT